MVQPNPLGWKAAEVIEQKIVLVAAYSPAPLQYTLEVPAGHFGAVLFAAGECQWVDRRCLSASEGYGADNFRVACYRVRLTRAIVFGIA